MGVGQVGKQIDESCRTGRVRRLDSFVIIGGSPAVGDSTPGRPTARVRPRKGHGEALLGRRPVPGPRALAPPPRCRGATAGRPCDGRAACPSFPVQLTRHGRCRPVPRGCRKGPPPPRPGDRCPSDQRRVDQLKDTGTVNQRRGVVAALHPNPHAGRCCNETQRDCCAPGVLHGASRTRRGRQRTPWPDPPVRLRTTPARWSCNAFAVGGRGSSTVLSRSALHRRSRLRPGTRNCLPLG